MPQSVLVVIFILLIVWLSVLSYFFYELFSHYNTLTKGATNKNLKDILDDVLKSIGKTKEDIARLSVSYDTMEKQSLSHINRIGLLRFNPFKDTGGDQSFILSLTDSMESGVIISGLYSRSGTRWYAKKIKNGKAIEHELSEEEQKVLKH